MWEITCLSILESVVKARLLPIGTIHAKIGKLTNLQKLYLTMNQLSGEESLQPYTVESIK